MAAAAALVAAGCGGAAAPPESVSDDVSRSRHVTIVADDYVYTDAPTEIPAGIIDLTFQNTGTVGHEVAMAGIGDTPIDQFLEDLRAGAFRPNGKPQPDYLDQVIVPSGAEAGESIEATFAITEGRYALFCVFTDAAPGDKKLPHYERGMLRELTVAGGDPVPQLGAADGTITAVDYGFEVDLEAGDRVVNFINEGPDEIHYSSVEVYPKGVSAEEAEAAYALQLEGRPTDVPRPRGIGFSGIFSAGLGSTFRLDRGIESGRTYLFVCPVQDRQGGEPHVIAYDMYRAVTIE